MIKALIIVAIILIGLCVSPLFIDNTGYVYIAIGEYQIETSLIVAITALVATVIIMLLTKWLLGLIINLALSSKHLPLRWRQSAAKKHTLQGAIAMAAEDWPLAEKSMLKGAANGELPTLNLLVAAQAAHKQKKTQARDEYLASAAAEPTAQEAVSISKIRFFMQDGEFSLARMELDKLTPTSKSPDAIIRISLELYPKLKDWQALKTLLPIAQKKQLASTEIINQLTFDANSQLVAQAATKNTQELDKVWHWLSKSERQDPLLALIYIKGLISFGLAEEGNKLLIKLVKHEPCGTIFEALPELVTAQDSEIRKQLMRHEASFENDASYQACVAKLCLQSRDIKEAKIRLQSACRLAPKSEYWLALAQVQEQLGENTNAAQSYRHASTSPSTACSLV
ncbi:HemY-like protein [Shewanella denitrificans OS217]|jgi:HemY protein|uniref:HemY-like protein n=1 Tax=Shewanella denitrificans (strain OS217 / ATCC BAA-1090 / DSM 15013) TaxID=318161 RepID=Q12S96_SHEDO|nr:heme biosynthesis HemY N-terminal domain-containing protein [Shewanella denitrificans]ABE53680.1 HemY-like protein [Shewanella denitrificans OS217]